jgi:enoyl-CoA hydratase/carnithine racemase
VTASGTMMSRHEGPIGYLIFNNPRRHNAVSLEMWERVSSILNDFAHDPAVRVVVLTGAGEKAFVAGADISRFDQERSDQDAIAHYNAVTEKTFADLEGFAKPTIAMIRGYCIGGGLALALGCDLRVCSENSRFALPAAKLGLGYGVAGLKRFVDIVGPAFTKEIFFTARQFDASEAQAMGLVNRVVGESELAGFVKRYADSIAANAPLTVAGTKLIIREVLKDASQRDLEACAAAVRRCFTSSDYIEGRNAFMEKRPPQFTGT